MGDLLLPAQSLERPLLLITNLPVTLDIWSIFYYVVNIRYNMLIRQWINFAQDGITTKVIPESIAEVVLVSKNTCLTIYVPLGMLGF